MTDAATVRDELVRLAEAWNDAIVEREKFVLESDTWRHFDNMVEAAKADFRAYVDTALATPDAGKTGDEWQLIETAPKQEGCLVAAKVNGIWCRACAYADTHGTWRLNSYGMEAVPLLYAPTHWKPIDSPSAPADRQESGALCHYCGKPLHTLGCIKGAGGRFGHVTQPSAPGTEAATPPGTQDAVEQAWQVWLEQNGAVPVTIYDAVRDAFQCGFIAASTHAPQRDSGADVEDWRTRFWQIVDGDGLIGLPSDEWNALRRLVDSYRSAPQRDAREGEWRPIESALNNASVLVAAATAVSNVGEARRTETPYGWRWYWVNVHWTDNSAEQIYPTHWQPLPPPPIAAADRQGGGRNE